MENERGPRCPLDSKQRSVIRTCLLTGSGPGCVETRPRRRRWSRQAAAQGEIEPEWREDLASRGFPRVVCVTVPEGLKIFGFSHSLGRKPPPTHPAWSKILPASRNLTVVLRG